MESPRLPSVGALNKARLEASLRIEGETNNEKKWPDLPTLASGLLLALSFFKYIYQPLDWLALGSVAIGFPRVLFRAIASIRALTLNINILVLLSVCATAALHDFWEAGVIIFLFSIAQWLETRATHKAMVSMSTLMSMAPQKAVVADTGEHVDVNDVKINTILAVKAGDTVPLDGVVVEGKCEIDEKMLTGEAFPVTKELDSAVWAGTINLNGYISVLTTVLAKDTVVARMSKLVEEAHSRKSRAQRFIDHFAKYYIPDTVFQIKEERNGHIYCGPALIGVFSLVDTCRSGALEAIELLKSLGVRSVMLTGDSIQTAKYVDSQLNHALDKVHAELLPTEKAVIIENLKKDGLTAMIGDGVNDAPALATADIGISMGISGSALAIETGNAILMSNDIRKIPEAIELARKTTRKLIENVIVSIGTKSAILALAIAGYPIIWLAVLTDVGTCLLVILNSMLILQDKSKNENGSKRSKYKSFWGDLSKPLLDKERSTEEQQVLLDAVKCEKICCKHESSGHSNLSLIKGNHDEKMVSGEDHAVKSSSDCCLDKANMCEDSFCRANNSSYCCQLLKEKVQTMTEKCCSGSVAFIGQDSNSATMESYGNKDKSMDISEFSETGVSAKCCKKGCCKDGVNDVSNLGLPEIVIE